MVRVLLVEDDSAILRSLGDYLRAEGYQVESACGEEEAVRRMKEHRPSLLLVDIQLAEGSGFAVSRKAVELSLPVIFLTASDEEANVVKAMELGAWDYVVKPFRPRELLSRMQSVLRRTGSQEPVLTAGEIVLDPERGRVTRGGEELALSPLEYRLLLFFLTNKGRLLTRERLLEEIWDLAGDYVNDNTLTVYIKRLREKIEDDPAHPTLIQTVRGMGYRCGE